VRSRDFRPVSVESIDTTRTPLELAEELGHDDAGRAIRVFLRNPDDGRGPFTDHLYREAWHLTAEQADRVRERFAF
jgi:hypothetical protein